MTRQRRRRLELSEEEWLTAPHPDALLGPLQDHLSARKLRLFACACCRRVPLLATEPSWEAAVAVAEAFADGLASRAELAAARQGVRLEEGAAAAWLAEALTYVTTSDHLATFQGTSQAAGHAARAWRDACGAADCALECRLQVDVLRDVSGHLYYEPVLEPGWCEHNGGSVRQLAHAIYEERSFGELGVLADALEEAGCNDKSILWHCRQPGTHVRGCWVVDAVLGKK
jgi:hypothetical protein